MTPRKRGRPSLAAGMNLLRHDIEDVAETIKRQILEAQRKGKVLAVDVHVSPDGDVRVGQPDLSNDWLVGSYTPTSPCCSIEDDLVLRWKEIR